MQHRYVGDIGDYVKYGLLRTVGQEARLGIAWYLYPDENHNNDGRHTSYLRVPERWARFNSELYAGLQSILGTQERSIHTVEASGLLPDAVFSSELLCCGYGAARDRASWRKSWFDRTMKALASCEVIFADPDNGLCEDYIFSHSRRTDWKRLPLQEADALSVGRTAILYHHNTRRKGGHQDEIRHWMAKLSRSALALRWRPFSPRTFLVVNPTPGIEARIRDFALTWAPHVILYES